MEKIQRLALSILLMVAFALPTLTPATSHAQANSRLFPETGKTVRGKFLDYWNSHGGLAQQGFPLSDEIQERNESDGKTYTVQYFERAVFELHPENQAPNDVLLARLGAQLYKEKYNGAAPAQQPSASADTQLFAATGKHVGGKFLAYWQAHGGLAQQGYPISEPFQEKSDANGQTYQVQYFERAVFELHPEYAGTSSEVLLSQLGRMRYLHRPPSTPSGAGCAAVLHDGVWKGRQSITVSATASGVDVSLDQNNDIEMLFDCSGNFDGIITSSSFVYRISIGDQTEICALPAGTLVTRVQGTAHRDAAGKLTLTYDSNVVAGHASCPDAKLFPGFDTTGQQGSGEITVDSYSATHMAGRYLVDQQFVDQMEQAERQSGAQLSDFSAWNLDYTP